MKTFDRKELPFDKYKSNLADYFRIQGIDVGDGRGMYRCPWHDDSTASLSLFTGSDGFPRFNCFGCGKQGDIYAAAGYFANLDTPTEQFREIERIFGNGEEAAKFTPPPRKERFVFSPDKDALAALTAWLESLPERKKNILDYFRRRAEYKTGGKTLQYPLSSEQLDRLATYFYWWPGARAAENALGRTLLFRAGVAYAKTKRGTAVVDEHDSFDDFPSVGREGLIYLSLQSETCYRWNPATGKYEKAASEPREVAWWHTGILAKSSEGFKLLYMDEKTLESMKKNPRTGVSFFPIPGEIPEGKPIVITEGEIDALVCRACGIDNVFSMGGLGNLSVPKIQKYILPKNIPEIILFADNDKAPKCQSQKAFGMIPYDEGDAVMETVPEKLTRAGYTGKIKVTSLPADSGFKDPDDAIRNGKRELVFEAIKNAREYVAPEKPAKKTRSKKEKSVPVRKDFYAEWDYVPLKFFKSILRIFKYSEMKSEDVIPFMAAMSRTCNEEGAMEAILAWCENAFTEDELKAQIEKNESATPYYLKDALFPKYNVSAYYAKRLEEYLIPAKEILNKHKVKKTLIPIDYEKIVESDELQSFLDKKGNYTGSDVLVRACDGNVIYLYEDKINYAYANGRWFAVPALEFIAEAFNILQGIVLHYLEKYPNQKGLVNQVLDTLNTRRFRSELVNDFNGNPEILHGKIVDKEVMFDSRELMGTTTLLDGVADFSGTELKFRKGKREEFRRAFLPYTVKEVKDSGEPKKFIKLMTANFRQADNETLKKNPTTTVETLMYYLALIQSRDTSRRYGGFFLGSGGTGKTTLLKILDAIYPNLTTPLNSKLLVHRHTSSNENPNGPTPETAKLEGKLLGYISETPENGKLDETEFKRLTGGDKLTARELHKDPHDFFQTAQIVIASNNSPAFSSTETATIDRMMIFRFNIKHEKGHADSKTPEQLIEYLRPEFPAIIKYFALKYIDLNINKKGTIPLSTECITEKGMYIDEQANDTDRFIANCLWFDTNSPKAFITCKVLYKCYLQMLQVTYNKEFREDAKETPSQRQFTTWLKKHVEFQHSYGQERVPDSVFPEYGFHHIAFTEYGLALLKQAGVSSGAGQKDSPQAVVGAPPPPDVPPFPDENPFADVPTQGKLDIY